MKITNRILIILFFPGIVFGKMDLQKSDKSGEDPKKEVKRMKYHEINTLAGSHEHSGGYGALFFKATSFKDQALLITGVRGAWIVNRSFGIGIDANGIIPVAKYTEVDPDQVNEAVLVGGYGGLLLEPILWSNAIVHLSFPLSFGAGWLGFMEDWENEYDYHSGELFDEDVFWYFEPGINAEVNVARFFRVGIGISRRFTQDLQLTSTSPSAFDKLNYGITLKFGGF